MDVEQRLIELESRLAFQDETIRTLSETIAVQDRHILGLQRELELLRGRLKELVHGLGDSTLAPQSEEGPPPHY